MPAILLRRISLLAILLLSMAQFCWSAGPQVMGYPSSPYFAGVIKAGSTPVTLTDSTGKVLSAALNIVAVAQGGTGVTTSTGTGSTVLSSGPTLTSPIIANIAPGANFTLTQNAVAALTSEETGAVANTLYLKAGNVGIWTATSVRRFQVNFGTDRNVAFDTDSIDGTGVAVVQLNDAGSSNVGALQFRGSPIYLTVGGTHTLATFSSGNVGIVTQSFGTSAAGVLALGAATAPSTSPADVVQLWGADIAGAGTFGLNIRDEGGNVFRIGNGQIIVPDGTTAAPPLRRTDSQTGIFFSSSGIGFSVDGAARANLSASEFNVDSGSTFSWNQSGVGSNLRLAYDAANILAQRNGVNAQTFRGYGTFTDATNYERWALSATIGTGITLAAETAGTGGDNLSVTLTPAGTGNLTAAIGAGGLFQVGSTLRFAVTDGAAGTGTRLRTAQATAPTCTTNCGTTPSISGSDTAMVLTLGTGSPASPVTVTFNGTWATAPACQAANRTTAANSISRVDSTTTTAVVYFLAGPAASDLVAITCLGVS